MNTFSNKNLTIPGLVFSRNRRLPTRIFVFLMLVALQSNAFGRDTILPKTLTLLTSDSVKTNQIDTVATTDIAQWKKFRLSEAKYQGTKITWKVRIDIVWGCGYIETSFGKEDDHTTMLRPSPSEEDHDGCFIEGRFPKMHRGDWLIIKGSFNNVTDNGAIEIFCDKILNQGANPDEMGD